MNDEKTKRKVIFFAAILLNIVLMVCVVCSVLSALKSAQKSTFSQNIENVRTLTNASANKVELEMLHHTQEIKTTADYVNNYNGVGMTEAELTEYFKACFGTQNDYTWQLVDSTVTDKKGFSAVSIAGDNSSFIYRTNAYAALAKIFSTANENTLGTVRYTSEFTDASPALAKSFAVTATIRIREENGQSEYQYKTLMMLIESKYISELIASNNNIDSLSFYDYSNIIIDDNGTYVISDSYFQGTNFLDYIGLYNNNFSADDKSEIAEKLKQADYSDVFYYTNHKGQECTYTIVPVQNSDWHILSIVPLASFHSEYDMGSEFLTFALLFVALFALDITAVLGINRQLIKATRKAKEANESKSLFLSSMSHDIRTPMNAIIGMTAIAKRNLNEETVDKDVLIDCMKSIESSGNHLLTLINDILDISKIESGKIILHPSDFSIADTMSQTIEMCQSRIREKNFVFEAHIHNVDREYVTGDSLRIGQIFTNILTNAVKYTEPGGKITVSLSQEIVADNPHLARYIYMVSDTGIGMTPEFVHSIFDRFTRALDTRINSVQGTGLGMAIVKQLVDLMGGTIKVESELNVGSTFTVTLELPAVQEKIEGIKYKELPVLLIDDDPVFLKTVKFSVESAGAVADTVCNGTQGIEMAVAHSQDNNPYKIIFVDWKMDNLSGSEVIKQLRQRLGNEVRIIVMTAYTIAEIEREARHLGADYFVTKPLFKSKLISVIESAISGNDSEKKEKTESFPDIHILVAEDNDTNWKIVSKLLTFYSINAVRATNGQEAVEIMLGAEPTPELVFMDIQMPIMNGYEATKAIRASADKKKASVPIYAMTADTFADDVKRCEEAGMNGHVPKPIDIKKMIEIIKDVYEKKNK